MACSKAHPDSGERWDSVSDSADDFVDDTGSWIRIIIQTAFFVVHLEPGSPIDPVEGGINHSRAANYLEQLVELTALADAHQHRLTLMLSPQWASYLISSECDMRLLTATTGAMAYGSASHSRCIELIREMEMMGHEMALHHHPLEAASGWDGLRTRISGRLIETRRGWTWFIVRMGAVSWGQTRSTWGPWRT